MSRVNQYNQKGTGSKKEEMRDSLRVAVHFPLLFTPLSEKEYGSIKDSFCFHRTSDREGIPSPVQDVYSIQTMEQELENSFGHAFVHMWRLLNNKLDLIYSTISRAGLEEWKGKATCIELGGQGLKMTEMGGALETDQYLKLRISPHTYPTFAVEVLGKIQRVEKKEDGNSVYEAAVVFEAINRDDQEALIAYLFKRQREIIRSANE